MLVSLCLESTFFPGIFLGMGHYVSFGGRGGAGNFSEQVFF